MTEEQTEEPTKNMVERAEAVAKRMEEANLKTEELLQRQEATRAKDILGGKSDAGQQPPEKKEESNTDYADKVMSGEANE